MKFETEHLNQFNNAILRIFKDYYCLHRFWINLIFNLNKIYNTTMLEVIVTK